MSNQSAMQQIREEIAKKPRGRPILMSSILSLASRNNAKQIFHRLVESGELVRVARRIYMRPKKSKYVGMVMPSIQEIVTAIAEETGETISIHGAEAARQLGLTAQMPIRPVYNTTGWSREIVVGKQIIKFKHVRPSKIILPGTIAGLVITALWYIGKDNFDQKTVEKIKERLSEEDFLSVIQACNKMPEWMEKNFKRSIGNEGKIFSVKC